MPSSTTAARGRGAAGGKNRPRRKPAWGKLLAFVLLFAVLAAAWRFTPLSEWLSADDVSGWARAVREYRWAPLLLVLAYTPIAFVMFPRPLLTLVAVIAFGPWLGFAYAMTGIMLSALATYYVGRVMKRETVVKLAGDSLEQVTEKMRRHGVIAVTAMRIAPTVPFPVGGIISGAIRIRMWEFLLGTLVGMAPGVLAASVFGFQISAALEDTSRINWWMVGGVIAVLVALSFVVKRWFTK